MNALSLKRFCETRRPIVLAALLLFALLQGVSHRFIQDDAFISFTYARNLLEGQGLTWFGTPVEGYTNFLWVLLISAGMRLGLDPIACAYGFGIAAFLAATFGLFRLTETLTNSPALACWTTLLFLTNFSVASYATGGLETMLQTALIVAMLLFSATMRQAQTFPAATLRGLSILAALAVMTRPDSAVPVVILLAFELARAFRRGDVATPILRHVSLNLLLPGGVIGGVWLGWKLAYYGTLLPNTFYAKTTGAVNFNGVIYLFRFAHWYLIWPFVLLGLIALAVKRPRLAPQFLPLLAIVAAWCAYVIDVGGDFMEFRFMIPITPALFLLLTALLDFTGRHLLNKPVLYGGAATLLLLSASWKHQVTFTGVTADMTLDSIPALSSFYWLYNENNWDWIGRPLGAAFRPFNATIATTAAGAIPYYARLRTVDMWGLNDPEIARRGEPVPPAYHRPGHRRHATLNDLKQQRVNVVIGHPQIAPASRLNNPAYLAQWARYCIYFNDYFEIKPIGDVTVLAFPIEADVFLLTWYLTPTPALDRLIQQRGWPLIHLRGV